MKIWTDRIEQRVMVKYFFLKGHGSKLIHKEFVNTLQNNAISLSTVNNWLKRKDSNPAIFPAVTRTAWKTFDFFGPGSSALSEEVSLRECSSNSRAFFGGSGYYQEHSSSGTGFEKIHSQMDAP
jgi:hypothetical protein